MALTLFAIQNAKPREKPYKLADGNGLHLLVNPNGSKLWRLRYRFGGKQNMLSLGAFPEVPLASARAKRDDARKLVAAGTDPSQQKKQDKIAAELSAENTFGAIAEEHLKELAENGAAAATLKKVRWLLVEQASALIKRPIAQITPRLKSCPFSRSSKITLNSRATKVCKFIDKTFNPRETFLHFIVVHSEIVS